MTAPGAVVPSGTCVRRAASGKGRAAPLGRCATGCPAYPFRCHRSLAEIDAGLARAGNLPEHPGDAPPC